MFGGWTSANGNVTFTDVNSAQTTFEATDTDTIYANFTQDTVYNVTVSNGRPASTSTVQAGTYVTPELTAAAPTDDEYSFSTWVLSGNVSLASGYNLTDQTIKINASGTGGTVTSTTTGAATIPPRKGYSSTDGEAGAADSETTG